MTTLLLTILIVTAQAILLALICLTAYFACHFASSRYKATLLLSGLVSLAALWLLVLLPIPNLTNNFASWIDNKNLDRISDVLTTASLGRAPLLEYDRRGSEQPVDLINHPDPKIVKPTDDYSQSMPQTIVPRIPTDSRAFGTPGGLERLQNISNEIKKPSNLTAFQWLFVGLAGTLLFGGLRLVVAFLSLVQHQNKCSLVRDPAIARSLSRLTMKLNIKRSVIVLESSKIRSACTTGWIRPRIILPRVWRTWTTQELESVLAHEAVHISNQDFVRHLIGQIGTAAHFYNPLAHWLLSRLRLEQELIADQTAAALVGDKQRYLTCLAGLALAQDDATDGWLSPMFLPTGKMLIRRVEMLRKKPDLKSGFFSPVTRCVAKFGTWITIATIAVAVAGLQLPEKSKAAATEPKTTLPAEVLLSSMLGDEAEEIPASVVAIKPSVDSIIIQSDSNNPPSATSHPAQARAEFISPATKAILIVRPSRISDEDAQKNLDKVFHSVDDSMQRLLQSANIPFSEVDQITLMAQAKSSTAKPNARNGIADAAVVYTTSNVGDRIKKVCVGEPQKLNGAEYFRLKTVNEFYVCLVDAQTIVVGTRAGIQAALNSRDDQQFLSRFNDWSPYATATGLILADGEFLNRNNAGKDTRQPPPKTFLAAFEAGSVKNRLELVLECNDARAAKAQRSLYDATKNTIGPAIAELRKHEELKAGDPGEWDNFMLLGELLESMKYSIDGSTFHASCESTPDLKWIGALPKVMKLIFTETPMTPSQ